MLATFLSRLSEQCDRSGCPLYRGPESRRGELCAVPGPAGRYTRGVVARETRDTAEVCLLDVGGRETLGRSQLLALPPEFAGRPEWGLLASLGCPPGPAATDPQLLKLLQAATLEVRLLHRQGEAVLVQLTNTISTRYRNAAILACLERAGASTPPAKPLASNARLAQLYEKQNGKQPGREQETNGRGGERGSRTQERGLERGDLRNSLREKRAARDRERAGPGLGVAVLPVGWRGRARVTWVYSPAHLYIQVSSVGERQQFEEMMLGLQATLGAGRGGENGRYWGRGQLVAARWTDGCWYRGQVAGARQGRLDIFFVDFGNTERVGREDLASLPPQFATLDCQAVRAALAGLEGDWEAAGEKLNKFFSQESYKAEVVAGRDRDGAVLVQLEDGDIAR